MIDYINCMQLLTKVKDHNKKYWFDYDFNMNIYRGCNHGCIYCDSRSDVYGIDNFDQVKVKKDALLILENELKNKRTKGVIGIGAMSDPYNKIEEDLMITREVLKLIDKYGFGVALATKSDLILRDIDILQRITKHSPVLIKITITCASDKLSKAIEPNVSLSSHRFKAIKKLREAGIYTGILLMPVIPFISDTENNIKSILINAAKADANFIYAGLGMSQRTGQRQYYLNKLAELSPEIRIKHERKFLNSYHCPANNRNTLKQIIEKYCTENNITYKLAKINDEYKKGYRTKQISLF